jgi:large subunit ribosomal protein L10
MALSKVKKQEIFNDLLNILDNSKLTVIAKYSGTSVKALQGLRKNAKETNSSVKVFKNRIVIKALSEIPKFKDFDTSMLTGMLMYTTNANDELASAKLISSFSKDFPNVEILGALTHDGKFIDANDTKELASIPTLDVLRGQFVGLIASPFSGFASILSSNLRGVLTVLNAHMEQVK